MNANRKAPRVPAGSNSLAAAYNRRAAIGAALLAPITVAACVTAPAPATAPSPLAAQWEIDRQILHEIDIFPDHSDDATEHLWAKISTAETIILDNPAQTVRDVIAKLKVSLLHSGADGWVDAALIEDNDDTLFARADELDMTPRLIIGAIRALTTMEARHG